MNPLYNAGIRMLGAGVAVAAMYRPKVALMAEGHRDWRARVGAAFTDGDRPVWIHAASLGEFEQGRPLIEMIRLRQPGRKILVTFFSPSGYEVRKNYTQADCVCYLPLDTPGNVRDFLDAVNPSVAVFVKYEFWGNYLEQLHARRIPTYLISAIFRPSQSFFRWWGGMFRGMLRCYDHIFVQDERSRRLLMSEAGVGNVTVAGDTRFDRVTDILRAATPLPAVETFRRGARLTLVVGSSWPADEERYLPWVNSTGEDVKIIIAPHEFDRERVGRLMDAVSPGRAVRFTEVESDPESAAGARCMVVDCFGKLASIYRYGDIAYIGGGFGAGIHNINEAAVYGIPVVFGPNHSKFKEASDLIACGGGFEVTDQASAASVLGSLSADDGLRRRAGEAAGKYISDNLGATERIYPVIFGK